MLNWLTAIRIASPSKYFGASGGLWAVVALVDTRVVAGEVVVLVLAELLEHTSFASGSLICSYIPRPIETTAAISRIINVKS